MRLGVRAIVDKDVWDYLVASATVAGSLGKLLKDNVNAPIGTVDTVVDAIKTKVDLNLDEKSSVIDTVVDAIKAKVDLNLDEKSSVIDAVVDAIKSTVDTNLDSKVSLAKADLTTLETRLSAVRAGYLDNIPKALKCNVKTQLSTTQTGATFRNKLSLTGPWVIYGLKAKNSNSNQRTEIRFNPDGLGYRYLVAEGTTYKYAPTVEALLARTTQDGSDNMVATAIARAFFIAGKTSLVVDLRSQVAAYTGYLTMWYGGQ